MAIIPSVRMYSDVNTVENFATYVFCGIHKTSPTSNVGQLSTGGYVTYVEDTSHHTMNIDADTTVASDVDRPSDNNSVYAVWIPAYAYNLMAFDYGCGHGYGSDAVFDVCHAVSGIDTGGAMGSVQNLLCGNDHGDSDTDVKSKLYYEGLAKERAKRNPIFNMDSPFKTNFGGVDPDPDPTNLRDPEYIALSSLKLTITSSHPEDAGQDVPPFTLYAIDMLGSKQKLLDNTGLTFNNSNNPSVEITIDKTVPIITPGQLHNLAYNGDTNEIEGINERVGTINENIYPQQVYAQNEYDGGYRRGSEASITVDYNNVEFDSSVHTPDASNNCLCATKYNKSNCGYGNYTHTNNHLSRNFSNFDTIVSPASYSGVRCGAIYIEFGYTTHDKSIIQDNGISFTISDIKIKYHRAGIYSDTVSTNTRHGRFEDGDYTAGRYPLFFEAYRACGYISNDGTGKQYYSSSGSLDIKRTNTPDVEYINCSAPNIYSDVPHLYDVWVSSSYSESESKHVKFYAEECSPLNAHMVYSSFYFTTNDTNGYTICVSGNAYEGINSGKFKAAGEGNSISVAVCGSDSVTLYPNEAQAVNISCSNIKIDGLDAYDTVLDSSPHTIQFTIQNDNDSSVYIERAVAIPASISPTYGAANSYLEALGGINMDRVHTIKHMHMLNTVYKLPMVTISSNDGTSSYKVQLYIKNCVRQLSERFNNNTGYILASSTGISIGPGLNNTMTISLPENKSSKAIYFDVAIVHRNEAETEAETDPTNKIYYIKSLFADMTTEENCSKTNIGCGIIQTADGSASGYPFYNERYKDDNQHSGGAFAVPSGTIFNLGQEVYNLGYDESAVDPVKHIYTELFPIELKTASIKIPPLRILRDNVDTLAGWNNTSSSDAFREMAEGGECLSGKYGIVSMRRLDSSVGVDGGALTPSYFWAVARHNDLYDLWQASTGHSEYAIVDTELVEKDYTLDRMYIWNNNSSKSAMITMNSNTPNADE